MRFPLLIGSILLSGVASAAPEGAFEYNDKGVFIVNEDWFGHRNSTVNYLMPDATDGDYWHYRVFQTENPGHELGCTTQFGAIWKGRFYFISKQARDHGSAIKGGRITVADAKTMRLLHQSEFIDPTVDETTGKRPACDGRGFLGIDEHKGYISTSSGIWVMNLDTYEVEKCIEGTGSGSSSIYRGQCGTMVMSEGKVFAAHQQNGLLVIDPLSDTLLQTIPLTMVAEKAGIGAVVKSKDGTVWLSASPNSSGAGAALNVLVKVDPVSLEASVVNLPDQIYGPANSWYAWTPDAFCASEKTNTLYWNGSGDSWFTGVNIFRYDIDNNKADLFIDLNDGQGWKLYGCSMRIHPRTDEIYMSLYQDFSKQDYITRRYSADGEVLNEYAMIANYWFPSLPVFPEESATDPDPDEPDPVDPDNPDSGVDAVSAQSSITFDGETVLAAGLRGRTLNIYSASGVPVNAYAISSEEQNIDMPTAPGIYIARCGNHTLKFIRK
ncbi:MAG: DUF5074 domain-containing protein [Muribaculum sp.]|nr:DUF5074 domain-containing protein [Muribaculum sp.]